MTGTSVSEFEPDNGRTSWAARLADTIIFIGVLLLPALAIAAVAIVAPIVLAASVIAGLIFRNAPATSWRRAGA